MEEREARRRILPLWMKDEDSHTKSLAQMPAYDIDDIGLDIHPLVAEKLPDRTPDRPMPRPRKKLAGGKTAHEEQAQPEGESKAAIPA